MKNLVLFVGLIALLVFGPLLTIWSLNTLFPVLAIPYTWKTWLAVIFVGGIVRGGK